MTREALGTLYFEALERTLGKARAAIVLVRASGYEGRVGISFFASPAPLTEDSVIHASLVESDDYLDRDQVHGSLSFVTQ